MSKKSLLIVGVGIFLLIGAGIWYYGTRPKSTSEKSSNSSESSLQTLVNQSSIVVMGTVRSASENRIVIDDNQNKRVSTDYIIDVDSQKYPKEAVSLNSFYLSLDGGTDEKGKKQTVEGVPVLEKGKTYLIFAKFSKDGRLRAVGNSTAVATIDNTGYTLPEKAGLTNFTDAELTSAVNASTSTTHVDIKNV